jgi:hypothetical protein
MRSDIAPEKAVAFAKRQRGPARFIKQHIITKSAVTSESGIFLLYNKISYIEQFRPKLLFKILLFQLDIRFRWLIFDIRDNDIAG